MDQYDEIMKTHVSKISPGSWSLIYPSEKMKSHLSFERGEMQKLKMGFLVLQRFSDLSSYLKLLEQKLSYCNSKI